MENCIKEAQGRKNKHMKKILIYFAVVSLTIIVNIFTLLFVSFEFIANITHYLSNYLNFLIIEPNIFPVKKILSQCFMLNIFLLLAIEFVVVLLFNKRLNIFLKIDNLFTIKKFFVLATIIIGLQAILSLLLWYI
jgi:hypothetical protein